MAKEHESAKHAKNAKKSIQLVFKLCVFCVLRGLKLRFYIFENRAWISFWWRPC